MNELQSLSDDLTTITTEIRTYQSIGGQAIFEIGKRLKWVKDNNLTHGEYDSWLSSLRVSRSQAHKFVKVYEEHSNVPMSAHLGINVLYEIATMPESEREKPQQLDSGEVKKPEDMTVKELREVKRHLKESEAEKNSLRNQLNDQQEENDSMRKQQVELNRRLAAKDEPKVIQKTVTKEVQVKPDDYDEIKKRVQSLENNNKELAKIVDSQKEELISYKDLEAQSRQAKHWENRGKISIYKLTNNIRDFRSVNNLSSDDKKAIADANDKARDDLNSSLNDLQEFIDMLRELTNGRRIVEGEIINE